MQLLIRYCLLVLFASIARFVNAFDETTTIQPQRQQQLQQIQTLLQKYEIPIPDIISTLLLNLKYGAGIHVKLHSVNLSVGCIEDLSIVLPKDGDSDIVGETETEELQNSILAQMIDASAKITPGILLGNKKFWGLYRQCIAISRPIPDQNRSIEGGFGRIYIDKSFANYSSSNACSNDSFGPTGYGIDVCVPKRCSNSKDLLQLSRSVRINGISPVCAAYSLSELKQKPDYRTWIVVSFLSVILAISIVSTVFDLLSFQPNRRRKFLQYIHAFSLYTNIRLIFTVNSTKSRIQVVDFFRVLSIFWILGGHSLMTGTTFTSNPMELLQRTHTDPILLLFANAYLAVDIFFFLSGLLVGYIWFRQYFLDSTRHLKASSWIFYYVHRLIRLSPPYYLIIAFYAFVYRTVIRDMPNFQMEFVDNCDKNWWINFIYMQNIIDYEHQCYFPTWYLATDMQLYVFSPIFLIILAVWPSWGWFLSITVLASSTAINMITVYANYFPPSDYPFGGIDPRLKKRNLYTLLIYQAPWIRCQIYIIGILTGYVLTVVKRLHINRGNAVTELFQAVNVMFWILSAVNCFFVIYVLRDWISGQQMQPLYSSLYSGLSRILWGLSLAYITVACHYGYGGLIGKFISSRYWIPFGRLSFSVYLLHFCVIIWLIGITDVQLIYSTSIHSMFLYFKSPIENAFIKFFDNTSGNKTIGTYCKSETSVVTVVLPVFVVSYLVAIIFSGLLEIPSANLEMLLFKSRRKNRHQHLEELTAEALSKEVTSTNSTTIYKC
uniref:NRF domain-containing protein n=1 Tax=Syphacia muris TaxID=451379 RepID=A0A0N5APQ7_9BILA